MVAARATSRNGTRAAERHLHRIEVETGDEPVRVTVGEEAGGREKQFRVAGGFTMFFNRVIDAGVWAALPDAARAVYLPLARLADSSPQGFRAKAGVMALTKLSGLSRSSVKRGLKALQEARLVVVVQQGGVAADGTNRPNVYELLVPEADGGSVQPRTPSRSKRDPAAGSPADPTPVQRRAEPGSAGGPQTKSPSQTSFPHGAGCGVEDEGQADPTPGRLPRIEPSASSKSAATAAACGDEDNPAEAAAEGLRRWGVDPAEAAALAAEHGAARVSRSLAEARRLRGAGKLRSAAGFLRWHLAESDGAADGPTPAADDWSNRQATARRAESAAAEADRGGDDALVDALSDADLDELAAAVRDRHAARPAMLRLLTAKPPRDSRLMRAEVAALLRSS